MQFMRTHDESRLAAGMQWPCVIGTNLVDVVPEVRRAELALVMAEARAGHVPATWLFPSAIKDGEMRLLQATNVRKHPLWVGITVFAVPAESVVPHDRAERQDGTGSTVLMSVLVWAPWLAMLLWG